MTSSRRRAPPRGRRPALPAAALAQALALLASLSPAALHAQEEEPPIPWYTVEVVVFERLDDAGLYEEVWPAVPEAGVTTGADEGEDGEEADAVPLAAAGEPREPFVALPAAELGLGGITAALRRSGSYRPLLHTAWRQPGVDARGAVAVAVADDSVSPSVEGTLRLHRARYLHLNADLLYRRAAPADADVTLPAGFRMAQSRKMRSEEIHYLDHPLFGVIVQVTPYEAPPPEPAPAAPDALLLDAPEPPPAP